MLEAGNETLEQFMGDFWRLYAETHLERSTRRKYRCLWNAHIERRLGAMELRQITPLVLSEFILDLQQAGTGAAVYAGKRRISRTYDGPVPYDLRHSFASLLIHEGKHSIMQIAEWMGHSAATLLTHYAHLIADLPGGPGLPNENAIKTARSTAKLGTGSSQIT